MDNALKYYITKIMLVANIIIASVVVLVILLQVGLYTYAGSTPVQDSLVGPLVALGFLTISAVMLLMLKRNLRSRS